MAIEKEIPKDIKDYKPKLIGPFTTRQICCLAPALALGVGVFFGLRTVLSSEVRLFLITLAAVPFFLIGWYEPYHMPFEKFIKTIFVSTVLSPVIRKYKTERMQYEDDAIKQQVSKSSRNKRKKKKCTDPTLQPYR